MAETTCLLNMRARNRTGGSNPPLSAKPKSAKADLTEEIPIQVYLKLDGGGQMIRSIRFCFVNPNLGSMKLIPLSPQMVR